MRRTAICPVSSNAKLGGLSVCSGLEPRSLGMSLTNGRRHDCTKIALSAGGSIPNHVSTILLCSLSVYCKLYNPVAHPHPHEASFLRHLLQHPFAASLSPARRSTPTSAHSEKATTRSPASRPRPSQYQTGLESSTQLSEFSAAGEVPVS